MKDRKKVIDTISKIRNLAVKLIDLEKFFDMEDLSEEIKDGVEKACWEVIKKINEISSSKNDSK